MGLYKHAVAGAGRALMEEGLFGQVQLIACSLCFLHDRGRDTSVGEGICGSPHFSEVSAFSRIREALGRCLSASVGSRLPPA